MTENSKPQRDFNPAQDRVQRQESQSQRPEAPKRKPRSINEDGLPGVFGIPNEPSDPVGE